jgi:NADH dehydrogenase [ubiquinone] 1 alpha subcomplex assembly factor 1
MKNPFTASLSVSAFFILSVAVSAAADGGDRPSKVDLKFDGDTGEPIWTAHNDNVMGGVSKGDAEIRDGMLHFTGSLSLENNGGFAQVRIRDLGYDLAGKKGLRMKVMGDGRTYQFRLATNARHRGSRIAYSAEFRTKAGEWIEVNVPFADLKPSHHGNELDSPPADLSQVEEMSLLIGDKREGPFSLKVDWMRTIE